MLPNHFVILWEDKPVGLDSGSGGYPYKTDSPNMVRYWRTREEAQGYIDTMQRVDSMGRYTRMLVKEIQFRIMENR